MEAGLYNVTCLFIVLAMTADIEDVVRQFPSYFLIFDTKCDLENQPMDKVMPYLLCSVLYCKCFANLFICFKFLLKMAAKVKKKCVKGNVMTSGQLCTKLDLWQLCIAMHENFKWVILICCGSFF